MGAGANRGADYGFPGCLLLCVLSLAGCAGTVVEGIAVAKRGCYTETYKYICEPCDRKAMNTTCYLDGRRFCRGVERETCVIVLDVGEVFTSRKDYDRVTIGQKVVAK